MDHNYKRASLKNTKRLTLDIPKEIHHQIKTWAVIRNKTMVKWVLRAILKEVEHEKKYE